MSLEDHLSSVECISIDKRGIRPHRYYIYVLIVTWSNGDKHPIYRKYSSFYDFERMLREKLGNVGIPELPQMNRLAKAFKLEKNLVSEINEFCQKIMSLPTDIVNSHTVSAFFEAWSTDYPVEESDERTMKKKDDKKKYVDMTVAKQDSLETNASVETVTPSGGGLPKSCALADEDFMGVQVYICTADYESDRAEELSLKEGMKCIVMEKNDDGWWFIMRENDGHQGYAPGSFLCLEVSKATDNTYSEITLQDDRGSFDSNGTHPYNSLMKMKVLTRYDANSGDEISCLVGEELDVLHTDNNGWWTVRSTDGKVGLVPAVHLQLCTQQSSRGSEVFFRNNSLYAREPPPRRQQHDSLIHSPHRNTHEDFSEPGYTSVEDILPNMAAKRLVPPPSKSKSEGLLNYAEIVFDEKDKPKFAKAASQGALKAPAKKQDTIIYTEIVPKNLRKPEQPVEDSVVTGRKPERGKALKKQVIPKIEEPKPTNRTPSPPRSAEPAVHLKHTKASAHEPSRSYENHSISPSPTFNDNSPTYVNVDTFSAHKGTVPAAQKANILDPPKPVTPIQQKNSIPAPQTIIPIVAAAQKAKAPTVQKSIDEAENSSQSMLAFRRDRYLRRSSIDPPPAPTVEAPVPSSEDHSLSSIESYSPNMSRVQATASYDGPSISGMLMFTKGDIATLMSKVSADGWWYVNLKGLEGYVPGAYWQSATPASSSQSKPKAPQPVPRTRSPPNNERSVYEQELWYHGKLTRPESEKLLANFSNGVYVIRESVNRLGDLTLSVRWEGKTRHFPIEAKDGGLYYIGKHDFKNLKAVIVHYSKHALFYSDTNEPVKLRAPATKQTTNA